MPYDASTGIYTSEIPDAHIPDGLSIYDLMFEETPGLSRTSRENATWLIDGETGRTLTYEQTKERTLDLAKGLNTVFGLGEKDTVFLYSGNEVDYGVVLWSSFRLSAIASCANPSYSKSELAFQLKLVNSHYPVKVLLTHPASIEIAQQACQEAGLSLSMIVLICAANSSTSPTARTMASNYKTLDDVIALGRNARLPPKIPVARDTIAFLSFSSGTTGLPKAVAIAHQSVVANVLQAAQHYSVSTPITRYDTKAKQGDVVVGALPFFHIYGLVVVLHLSMFLNTPVVTLNKFTLPSFLKTVEKHKVTQLYIVPPIIVQLIKNPLVDDYDLSSVRWGMTGAAPLSIETFNALCAKFPKWIFGQGYGMTETCTLISSYIATRPIPGASAGILCPNVQAKVVSPDGRSLGPGEIGELYSRSPSNTLGYLGNEKATKETFTSDGFVITGDEVRFDEVGNLYVVDRIKELIKVLGNQVAPAELEGLILEHPDVSDCAVIGIPNDKAGEVPKAYVALNVAALARVQKGETSTLKIAASIMKLVADNKINYKHVKTIEFLDAIPKTASGKLLRKDLRVLHAASEKAKSKL